MKKIYTLISALLITAGASAETLNVSVGNVTYCFPASQTGEMTYTDGTQLTIMGKAFSTGEISAMYVDNSEVVDGTVAVTYSGTTAAVRVAGNIARHITPLVEGAHVSVTQSADVAEEITYILTGSSTDGEFYTAGSYNCTVELNGLDLTNATPVYSGAAINVKNSKLVTVSVADGTVNTLTDAASGSQKGCLYISGQAEFAQHGTLNVTGNLKHAIKSGCDITVNDATINVVSAVGDGISCNKYFIMESGTLIIRNTQDDGIQCNLDGTVSTGETTGHENEDSGNIYLNGGSIDIIATGIAAKGIKCEGDMNVCGGTITVKTTGIGKWDSSDLETKAACGMSSDGNMNISGDCNITLTATGAGGKGMKCDGVLTVTGGNISIATSGGLYYNDGTTENTNYTGNTDNVSSDYYSSPKGIKAGVKTENGNSYTYTGGISISGGTITVSTTGRNAEGIESKNYLNIDGGHITINAYDDAINSAQDLTITDGYVYAHSANNDGLDANGNCYIKGGLVYAIGARSPEVAIDANSEEGKKFYFTGGTLVAIGGLESSSSLSQTCKQSSTWKKNVWYALYNNSQPVFAFKTPSSAGNTLVVSTSGTVSLKSGVTVSGGTEYFGGVGIIGGTISGGSTESLSNYSSGGGRPGGF